MEGESQEYNQYLDQIICSNFSQSIIEENALQIYEHTEFIIRDVQRFSALLKAIRYVQNAHANRDNSEQSVQEDHELEVKVLNIELHQSFKEFQPLGDDIFQDLDPVRSCIGTNFSLQVLKGKLNCSSILDISLPSVNEHDLSMFIGMDNMTFTFKYSDDPENWRFSLPRDSDVFVVTVHITDIPANSEEKTLQILSNLSSVNRVSQPNSFFVVYLSRCGLSLSQVHGVMESLMGNGDIHWDSSIETLVQANPGADKYCSACFVDHDEDIFCCSLQLPNCRVTST